MVQDIELFLAPYYRTMSLAVWVQTSQSWTHRFTSNDCVKERHPLSTWECDQ